MNNKEKKVPSTRTPEQQAAWAAKRAATMAARTPEQRAAHAAKKAEATRARHAKRDEGDLDLT